MSSNGHTEQFRQAQIDRAGGLDVCSVNLGGPFAAFASGLASAVIPKLLRVEVPTGLGRLRSLVLIGAFGAEASEHIGNVGAVLTTISAGGYRSIHELVHGLHYVNTAVGEPRHLDCGDGIEICTIGSAQIECSPVRVDLMSVHVDASETPVAFELRRLGDESSFLILDVLFDFETSPQCPFRSSSGGITLGDLPSIVRLGDRVRLVQALEQLHHSLEKAEDLDEARGLALTFLAMVTAATLELGGSRTHHRVQLEAARELDRVDTVYEIFECTRERVAELARFLEHDPAATNERLINRAIGIVDRKFATELTDEDVASQLGLSTSHFRHLFRLATGQPFHKYLIAVRLEKARGMIQDSQLPITAVAQLVGFSGISHFSRAFSQRFDVSPTDMRRRPIDD